MENEPIYNSTAFTLFRMAAKQHVDNIAKEGLPVLPAAKIDPLPLTLNIELPSPAPIVFQPRIIPIEIVGNKIPFHYMSAAGRVAVSTSLVSAAAINANIALVKFAQKDFMGFGLYASTAGFNFYRAGKNVYGAITNDIAGPLELGFDIITSTFSLNLNRIETFLNTLFSNEESQKAFVFAILSLNDFDSSESISETEMVNMEDIQIQEIVEEFIFVLMIEID